MRINISAMKEEGFYVCVSDDGKMIDIYPRVHNSDAQKYIYEKLALTDMQAEDILMRVSEYQIFNAIKKTGAFS